MRPSFGGSGYDKLPFECQLYSVHPVLLDFRNIHDCGFSIASNSKRSLLQADTLHRHSSDIWSHSVLYGRESIKLSYFDQLKIKRLLKEQKIIFEDLPDGLMIHQQEDK